MTVITEELSEAMFQRLLEQVDEVLQGEKLHIGQYATCPNCGREFCWICEANT